METLILALQIVAVVLALWLGTAMVCQWIGIVRSWLRRNNWVDTVNRRFAEYKTPEPLPWRTELCRRNAELEARVEELEADFVTMATCLHQQGYAIAECSQSRTTATEMPSSQATVTHKARQSTKRTSSRSSSASRAGTPKP